MNNKAHLRPDDYDSNGDIKVDGGADMKNCKNCDYYVNNYGYGQCYGQKNAPRVDDNDSCNDFKARTTTNESEVTMTDKIKRAIKEEFHYRASQGRTNYSMEELLYIVNEVIDEVKFENNTKTCI